MEKKMPAKPGSTLPSTQPSHIEEVLEGERFAFGKNWRAFLDNLNEERVLAAERSLTRMLDVENLSGATWLDIGSGSGLFSLAARRLGAQVVSVDYDPESVACTRTLRERFFSEDPDWRILEGSVLDRDFINALGRFDYVYCWGVLHHTGDMITAMDNARVPVNSHGQLYIMIYEDRGWKSRFWRMVKRTYCSGVFGRVLVLGLFFPYYLFRGFVEDVIRLQDPRKRYRDYFKDRGMSRYHDWIDWLGGYPYEFASPAEVVDFYKNRGFDACKVECPEYVFTRTSPFGSVG